MRNPCWGKFNCPWATKTSWNACLWQACVAMRGFRDIPGLSHGWELGCQWPAALGPLWLQTPSHGGHEMPHNEHLAWAHLHAGIGGTCLLSRVYILTQFWTNGTRILILHEGQTEVTGMLIFKIGINRFYPKMIFHDWWSQWKHFIPQWLWKGVLRNVSLDVSALTKSMNEPLWTTLNCLKLCYIPYLALAWLIKKIKLCLQNVNTAI